MNYIINPVWFYLMFVVDALKTLSIICAVLCLMAFAGFLLYSLVCYGEEETKARKTAIKFIHWCIVFTLLAVFVPNKSTLLQIMIAKYATYENADSAIQAIKSAADYVIEAAGNLK